MTELAVHTEHEPELLIPDADVEDPELSIVIPALNEELTITEFVRWCLEGLASAGVRGEILIVDSSTDSTAKLAREAGARVLRVPKRGLGRAYMDAIPYIRGRWVLMGQKATKLCGEWEEFRGMKVSNTHFIHRLEPAKKIWGAYPQSADKQAQARHEAYAARMGQLSLMFGPKHQHPDPEKSTK